MGETVDAGHQIGVQRTVSVTLDELWGFLTSSAGVQAWLGAVEAFSTEPGSTYETADGTSGEIRAVSEGSGSD